MKLGLFGSGATMLPVGIRGALDALGPRDVIQNIVKSPPVAAFQVPLRIPPVLQPVRSTATTDFYEITETAARVPIIPGLPPTEIWGYNGQFPGPTIRQDRSRDVVVRQFNRLRVPTSTHLHGGAVAADSDGHPVDLVGPGDFKDYFYPGLHPAANLFYHDHAIHETGRNMWRGLGAMYLITDDAERALPLPKDAFEVPLVIQDRFFLGDGSAPYPLQDLAEHQVLRQGAFGDVILVNGTPKPFFRVAGRRYRFRILNGSNARMYRLKLSNRVPFTVVGTDGGLLPHPVETADIVLSPSERIDVVVDFGRFPIGTSIVLENRFGDELPGDPFDPRQVRQVMRFDVVEDVTDPSSVPDDLGPLPPDLDPSRAVRTREWRFDRSHGAWTINGKLFDANRVDARPVLGTVEIWKFINNSGGWLHPAHPHLVEFLILDRTRRPLQPYERGPKDTVLLGKNEAATVVISFNHFRGRYAFHCHNMEHEDHDMMTQYEVV
jgi:FtsP/CotA-like multicopper oxidase with cupredoxin domain